MWYNCVLHFQIVAVKVKIKFSLEEAMKAQRGSRDTALLFLQHRSWMGWVLNATPRPLYSRERPSTLGWVGHRAGLDWCRKSSRYQDSIPGPSSQ